MRIDTTKRLRQRDLESPIHLFTDPFPLQFTTQQTVADVLHTLLSQKNWRPVDYVYITDEAGVLQGVVSLRHLFFQGGETLLSETMEGDVIRVYEEEPLEKGLRLLSDHALLALPVVNKQEQFLGVLEILPHTQEHVHSTKGVHYRHLKEDLFQFIGFSIEQRKQASIWYDFRTRMPWLLCNLVGGLICAVISQFFAATLQQLVLLAFFIPLVLTLSESVGIQAMTLSFRFLHLRKIQASQIIKRLFREGRTSILLGTCCALLIACFYFAWNTDISPIVAIGVSVIAAMGISALFGSLFPILLHWLSLDPKVAAGPVVLMCADVLTISLYLSINTIFIQL